MLYISGIAMNSQKNIYISLQNIYGIGYYTSIKICKKLGICKDKKVKDLLSNEIQNIQQLINDFILEGDLKKQIYINIKRLKDIKSYRGIRHIKKLPCRGQRTKTNAKTNKKLLQKK